MKNWKKNTQKSCSESAQTPFSHSPAQASAHSPKLIFHIKKFRDQTSVLNICVVGALKKVYKIDLICWSTLYHSILK